MDRLWKSVQVVSLGVLVLGLSACADQSLNKTEPVASRVTLSQTTCPVMGGEINKSLYVDYDGKRIYVCCPGCVDVLKGDPAKYVKQLEDAGITLEKMPALCPKCGEIKGSAKCCKLEGRGTCPKCGLFKGSPGCCKLPLN